VSGFSGNCESLYDSQLYEPPQPVTSIPLPFVNCRCYWISESVEILVSVLNNIRHGYNSIFSEEHLEWNLSQYTLKIRRNLLSAIVKCNLLTSVVVRMKQVLQYYGGVTDVTSFIFRS
jgi:hypothetical protein